MLIKFLPDALVQQFIHDFIFIRANRDCVQNATVHVSLKLIILRHVSSILVQNIDGIVSI